jgi:transposase
VAKLGRRAAYDERLRAVQAIERGKSADLVGEIFGFARSTVFGWWQGYRESGEAALRTKPTSGPASKLSEKQLRRLSKLLVGSDPRQLHFEFALWTRAMVAELIRREFGVRLSLATVGRVLHKLDMSPQRPVYRAWQADPEAVEVWKAETYPTIRAEAKRQDGVIFFGDEASVRTDYHAGTTGAPVGRTPVVTSTGARMAIKMVSAISPRGELRFRVHEGTMDAARFIEFCKGMLHDIDRPIFLIVDGSSVHKAAKVKDFVASTDGRLQLFFLPSYSPQLNPDEWVWKNVKHDRIARKVPQSKADLKAIAHGGLRRLQQLPDTVQGFFRDPHLAYITEASLPVPVRSRNPRSA